jgi:hypothetical protein
MVVMVAVQLYLEQKRRLVLFVAMAYVFVFAAMPVLADGSGNVAPMNNAAGYDIGYTTVQTTVIPTLALQADVLTSGLFTGANIILLALGGIIFLLVGLVFGGKILDAIRNMVQGLRIG